MPKFKNTENPCHTSKETGDKFWHSRSMAVCIRVKVVYPEYTSYLITKRGKSVTDSDKWCLPCGYLDRSETLIEAAQRELFEETGLYVDLDLFKLREIVDCPKKDALQNVTFHYDVTLDKRDIDILNDMVKYHVENHLDEGEVVDYEFTKPLQDRLFAFNHQSYISS